VGRGSPCTQGFLLTAIEGELNGGGGTDRFRIKIWDRATDLVLYDNQLGADEYGTPPSRSAAGASSSGRG